MQLANVTRPVPTPIQLATVAVDFFIKAEDATIDFLDRNEGSSNLGFAADQAREGFALIERAYQQVPELDGTMAFDSVKAAIEALELGASAATGADDYATRAMRELDTLIERVSNDFDL